MISEFFNIYILILYIRTFVDQNATSFQLTAYRNQSPFSPQEKLSYNNKKK